MAHAGLEHLRAVSRGISSKAMLEVGHNELIKFVDNLAGVEALDEKMRDNLNGQDHESTRKEPKK